MAKRRSGLETFSMKRILIADDHAMARSGLRAILEARAGWEVVEACGGREAVTRAIEERPDVAIVDYSMPFMTGLNVTRCIKEHRPATEVLIFTVHETSELALGAFGPVPAPFWQRLRQTKCC
jgi:DNA-binding NarL/FixJ family response regulator